MSGENPAPPARSPMSRQLLWINAGELSGDMQAGALLRELRRLRPDLKAVGMGGPHLAAAAL